ncbi:hypothetical protein OnM2_029067 [Erysiphe neolycopersici]|uniref:Myb-like domain-containing protein n=1 Tax=Erysiphe neolycopersici TaxID=212602 RepID=A0A420HZW9_9PEZI|nr:hypothetical protein OnM2_029067 [Erysiphe neolycopersici]
MFMLPLNESGLVAQSHVNSIEVIEQNTYEVHKNRKQPMTGGIRAWSKEEEVYLLQARLQKIPYRHIAAHLKKTELACRLHFHHLSHGSRRKKASSASPSSTPSSPLVKNIVPLSLEQSGYMDMQSPPQHYFSPGRQNVQLPSASTLLSRSDLGHSPRNFDHILSRPYHNFSSIKNVGYNEPLQLDTDMHSNRMDNSQVDSERLSQIYEKHRASFWNLIASEYGAGSSPLLLERAWKRGTQIEYPPSPCVSPNATSFYGHTNQGDNHNYQVHSNQAMASDNRGSVNISDLLGIDANPRNPEEREMIRRMEERREIMT